MNYFYIAFKYSKYQIKYTENVYSIFLVLELKTDKVLKIRAATKGSEMHTGGMSHPLMALRCLCSAKQQPMCPWSGAQNWPTLREYAY